MIIILGKGGTAVETLVTAISMIKQSKIAQDDRCKLLISSLQDTLKGIEDKLYGSRYIVKFDIFINQLERRFFLLL